MMTNNNKRRLMATDEVLEAIALAAKNIIRLSAHTDTLEQAAACWTDLGVTMLLNGQITQAQFRDALELNFHAFALIFTDAMKQMCEAGCCPLVPEEEEGGDEEVTESEETGAPEPKPVKDLDDFDPNDSGSTPPKTTVN